MLNAKQRQKFRNLAAKWMEFANLPVMKERKRQWKAIKDLQAEKPMILVETCMLMDYVDESEIISEDRYLRNLEKYMIETVRHGEEIQDDIVFEPYLRIPYILDISDYGVPIESNYAQDANGMSLGFSFNHPIKTFKDVDKLRLRSRRVDLVKTKYRKELLEDIMGDIIKIRVGGYDPFFTNEGYNPWLGCLYAGLTMDLFKLIGNENLLLWVYDNPKLIHNIMSLLRNDRIAHFQLMEKEKLLFINIDTYNPGPGSYGYVSDLPAEDRNDENIRLKDCWCWADGQEIIGHSPTMINEFFLPYTAEITNKFGLLYYGCCEGLHDRFECIEKTFTNLRAVSVSRWSNLFKMGELIGKKYVYSRKPFPAFISSNYPNWDLLKKDIKDTLVAAKGCNLEILFRDIYTINWDRARLKRWAEMAKNLIGC